MKLYCNRLRFVRVGMVCTGLLAAAVVLPGADATDWTKNYTISGRANVRIDTNDGSVRVTTSDTKTVQFRVEYEGYELDRNLHIESSQNGDSVELTARTTGHWGISIGWHNSRRLHIE